MEMPRIAFLIIIISLFTGNVAEGADFKAGESISVSRLVNNDLYAAGATLNFDAIIEGDLLAAGGNLTVNDSIMGDFTAAGGNLLINGPIGDDARLAGGVIKVTRGVMGDLIILGGEFSLGNGAVVMGDLVIFGGSITVNGTVEGDLIIKGGACTINGTVNGDTNIQGGEISLNGDFRGNNHQIAGELIDIHPEAGFSGNISYWQKAGEINNIGAVGGQWNFDPSLAIEHPEMERQYWGVGIVLGIFAMLLATILLITLYWLLFRNAFEKAGAYIYQQFLNSFGAGILYFFAFPPIAIFLMVIIIGIPVGLFMLGLYLFIMFTGHAIAGLAFAYSLKSYYQKSWHTWQIVLVALGIDLLLKFIMIIPFIGILISVIAVATAVGGLIIYIWQGYRKPAVSNQSN